MLILRWLLLPFTILYTFIIWVRNQCYDLGILTSKSFAVNTVVVGNLAVGGAGKSPLVQLLVDKLQADHQIATLSRGYGRKTRGFRIVQVTDSAEQVGDEPLQLKKNHPNITVAVDENRAEGIEILRKDHNLILLDDAFQHRKVKPTCAILLFEYDSLLKPILLLPTGNFRDGFDQAKRADLILITKCPENINKEDKERIERKIRKQNKTAAIFYSCIVYKPIRPLTAAPALEQLSDYTILLLTGIANPKPLEDYLSKQGITFNPIAFPDHHLYSHADYNKILDSFKSVESNRKIILTTEKDAQRLDLAKFSNIPLYYIPIETKIDQEIQFLSQLNTFLIDQR